MKSVKKRGKKDTKSSPNNSFINLSCMKGNLKHRGDSWLIDNFKTLFYIGNRQIYSNPKRGTQPKGKGWVWKNRSTQLHSLKSEGSP